MSGNASGPIELPFSPTVYSLELAEWAGKRDSEDFLKSGLAELYFNLTVGFSTL